MINKLLGDVLTAFYEDCRAKAFQKEIMIWQGNGLGLDFVVIQHLKNANNLNEIIERITVLTEEKEFQEFVLDQVREAKTKILIAGSESNWHQLMKKSMGIMIS